MSRTHKWGAVALAAIVLICTVFAVGWSKTHSCDETQAKIVDVDLETQTAISEYVALMGALYTDNTLEIEHHTQAEIDLARQAIQPELDGYAEHSTIVSANVEEDITDIRQEGDALVATVDMRTRIRSILRQDGQDTSDSEIRESLALDPHTLTIRKETRNFREVSYVAKDEQKPYDH